MAQKPWSIHNFFVSCQFGHRHATERFPAAASLTEKGIIFKVQVHICISGTRVGGVSNDMHRLHCCRQCKWTLPLLCILFHIHLLHLPSPSRTRTSNTVSRTSRHRGGKQMLRLNSPSQHMLLISLLVLLEIAVSADILLNSDWEKV